MEWVDVEGRIPVKIWCKEVEQGALDQARNIANLPFAFRHIALMPDVHQGYGMPIGGVLATEMVVVPNCVGVDIGCGMIAVKTSHVGNPGMDVVKKIIGKLRNLIPVGFKHHESSQHWDGFMEAPDIPIIQQQVASARKQLGTLGGGNHFIEVQLGDDNHIWLMLHSGSRNFGCKIAREYHEKAKRLCERWHSSIPDKDLAFLPMETHESTDYMNAMNYALCFAKASREAMMTKFFDVTDKILHCNVEEEPLDIHHNYARWENHFGKNVIIHRKGATSAKKGELGIIPGSQGSASYIVRGLANKESFMSCSHGAGRTMGRKQAKRELDLKETIKVLDEKNIVHSIRNTDNLDEAPQAYKDIDEVMKSQADLVEVVVKLEPLGVLKG